MLYEFFVDVSWEINHHLDHVFRRHDHQGGGGGDEAGFIVICLGINLDRLERIGRSKARFSEWLVRNLPSSASLPCWKHAQVRAASSAMIIGRLEEFRRCVESHLLAVAGPGRCTSSR